MDDRRELDDAGLEMLGVQSADQRQALIDELYGYLREFFEETRQKEEKAIINKNKARRLVLVRPGEVADQILAEIKEEHPELLRRYDPDFLNLHKSLDTYDLPAEGQPQELRDLYHDRGVVFMKGKKSIAAIDTHMPEQDPLIFSFLTVFGIGYNCARRRRRALVITDTEEKLMAAAAMIGLSKIPNQG